MSRDEPALEVEGLAFSIPPAALEAALRGEGIQVQLTNLRARLTETALNALLARLVPEGQPGPTARLSEHGVEIEHQDDGRDLRLDLPINAFRVEIQDGQLRISGGAPDAAE